ncbi:cytochrome P450 [Xylariaceae sp. FL0016]|nr:cytochrome P450 [Xylariaceae sp. FL0016]
MMVISAGALRPLWATVALILVLWFLRVFYQGLSTRLRFRGMKAQGLPVPHPHSWLLGHIPLMKSLKEGLPKDAHDTYVHRKLVISWREYFPQEKQECPPVIYLDLWPLLSQPFVLATSPEACYQLTQKDPQPRHSMFSWAMSPVTGGKDLMSMDIPTHRLWRSRLNPGFSMQNILSQFPIFIQEVGIFATQLKSNVGADGGYGDSFTLFDKSSALTFDIITRTSVDLRLREQTEGPTPMFRALRRLITHVKARNLRTIIGRLTPSYRHDVAVNSRTLDDTLLPQIKSRLRPETSSQRTVIDLAVSQLREEAAIKSVEPNEEFIAIVLSQLKLFVMAGHDTTAQAICWLLYEIGKSPHVLSQLRAEHDEVLGPDPKAAEKVLSDHPNKLNALCFTTAVIKESLRLHPIGATHRQGSPAFKIVHRGVVYPTDDCLIFTSPTAVHLRPDLWPRVAEFLPERFLVTEGHPLHPVKNAWRPFELGSTRCIGQELAMIEMKLVLVLMIRELDFTFDGEQGSPSRGIKEHRESVNGEHIYRAGNGLGTPKDKMPMRVRLRLH